MRRLAYVAAGLLALAGATAAETPGNTPAQTPVNTAAETPGNTPAQTPVNTAAETPGNTLAETPADNAVAQGKYLAAAGDCTACHTTPGGAAYAGGVVIPTPFGKLYGSNITPDPQTGIGNWTADEFVNAVKYGIGHDGRLYPGMPYPYFNRVPRDQIIDIFDYLETLPPVHHPVVSDQLPFPFSIRFIMRGWNLLFFQNRGDFKPDPNQSAPWNRGAFLVQGLTHCAACHTPKNIFGADKTGQEFTGYDVDGLNAPSLVDSRANGLGVWTPEDIARYLKTGHNQYADASGAMASVVTHSTSQLTLADDTAIGTYIHSLPAPAGTPVGPIGMGDPQMQSGKSIYAIECAACHTYTGQGQPNIFPSLVANPAVVAPKPLTLVHVVEEGAQSVGTVDAASGEMPAFHGVLTDDQIANVLTYIRNAWGNAAPAVQASDVDDLDK